MGQHPGHRQAIGGTLTLAKVVASGKVDIPHDGIPGHGVEAQPLGGEARPGGHDNALPHHPGIAQGPLQGLLPPQGPADDRIQVVNAQFLQEGLLHHHPVPHGDHGKGQAIGLACGGIQGGWPSGAVATAQHIGADDEKPVRVNGLARADDGIPPPRMGQTPFPLGMARRRGIPSRHMGIPRQRMADEDGVVLRLGKLPVGLIFHLHFLQARPALQKKGMGGIGNPKAAGRGQPHRGKGIRRVVLAVLGVGLGLLAPTGHGRG